MTVRVLAPGDEALLEAFLSAHRDSSMFLRGNARRAGLEYQGQHAQALYVAGLREGKVIGVVAHCWNGMILVQAPEHVPALARACVELSGREVTGLAGPQDHVRQVRAALGLERTPTAMDGGEGLYALDLADAVVPDALSNGTIAWRPPLPEERDLLRAWRLAYDIELLGATDTPEARQRSAEAFVRFGHCRPAMGIDKVRATVSDAVFFRAVFGCQGIAAEDEVPVCDGRHEHRACCLFADA